MEERELISIENLPPVPGEIRERILPELPRTAKKRISIYLAVTTSVFLLTSVFSAVDFLLNVKKEHIEDIPSAMFSHITEKRNDEAGLTLSEYLTEKMFGIDSGRYLEVISADINEETDEQKNAESEKDNIDDKLNDKTDVTENISDTEKKPTDNEEELPDLDTGKEYPIISMDLSRDASEKYYIGNETAYSPDVKALLNSNTAVSVFSEQRGTEGDEPVVLIIHTHGTESYSMDGSNSYFDNGEELWRSRDRSENVVSVGKLMAEVLNGNGIKTVHCDKMHDEESYQDSYTRAAETIKSYLAKYPSIKYVFDVHRDAILRSDGTLVKSVTELDGTPVAQVMTVVGSNYKGANFPDWEKNLSLALKLKDTLDREHPTLSRPVYLRGAAYNQQYTDGSLLLEIGSAGNTLSEAKAAARLVAEALSEIIKGK